MSDYQEFLDSMTTISRRLFEQTTDTGMTLSEAVACLKENAAARTLWSTITKYSPRKSDSALKKELAAALIRHQSNANVETVQRRVRDWAKSAGRTIDKSTAWELCFALKLNAEQADGFLSEITEEGVHWRDPQEIICIFALEQGLSYPEARALMERIADIEFDKNISRTVADDAMTAFIRDEFSSIRSADDLITFIREEQARLGSLHQTAYHMFDKMMNVLATPSDISEEEAEEIISRRKKYHLDQDAPLEAVMQYDQEKKITVRDILTIYLHRSHVPQSAKKAGAPTSIERMIFKNWPSEKELSQMKTRTIDVSRKVLMLLFLATDGITDDESLDDYGMGDDDFWMDGGDSEQEEFESSLLRLNGMLQECGMRLLDPRLPFDWMILYCLCSSDALTLDSQIQKFLDTLYNPGDDL